MAAADYRLCDVCDGKVFYDANLNYEQGRASEWAKRQAPFRWAGEEQGKPEHDDYLLRLDYLGDWAVICDDCAKTHKTTVVPIESAPAEPKRKDQSLRDLLAIIHRDGGHHTAAVGIEQSIKDAQAAVCELKRELAMGKHDPVLIDLLKQAEKCLAAGVRVDQTAPDEPPISEWDYEADRLSAEIFAWMKVHGIGGSDGN